MNHYEIKYLGQFDDNYQPRIYDTEDFWYVLKVLVTKQLCFRNFPSVKFLIHKKWKELYKVATVRTIIKIYITH